MFTSDTSAKYKVTNEELRRRQKLHAHHLIFLACHGKQTVRPYQAGDRVVAVGRFDVTAGVVLA